MTMVKRRRKRKRKRWNSEFGGSRLSPAAATSVIFKPRRLEEDELNSKANCGSSFGSSNEWSDNYQLLLANKGNKLKLFVDLEESERDDEVTLDFIPNRRDCPLLLHKKTPSEAQLDKFFAAAENNLHKQFLHKYNYDIVKDRPMEGKYEWLPIHQN